MPTYAENLTTARDQLAAYLVTATLTPKPNYVIEGQNVSHADALKLWTDQIGRLNDLIRDADGPDEYLSEAYVLPAPRQRSV